MNTDRLILLPLALLSAAALVLTTACGDANTAQPTATPAATAMPEHAGHEMKMGADGHMDGMKGMEHQHDHGGMGGHMAHMNDVKARLQAKLGDAYDVPVAGLADADIPAGGKIYATTCSPCHGLTGKGDGPAAAALPAPPADHTDPDHAGFYSDAGRMEVIRSGIAGTPMAGFGAGLSDTDLLNLYGYVASLRGDGSGQQHHGHGDGDHDHADGDHDNAGGDHDHADGDHDHADGDHDHAEAPASK